MDFYGCTNDPIALVVEFCAGGSLVDRLSELDSAQQWTVAVGVAIGVRHLHLEKVRDCEATNRKFILIFFIVCYQNLYVLFNNII